MRKFINIITESSETNQEMVNRIHGEELSKHGLTVSDFKHLDPTPYGVYLKWLVSTYLKKPYDLDNRDIQYALSLINNGDTFSYNTMDDFLASMKTRLKRLEKKSIYNRLLQKRSEAMAQSLPDGWRAIDTEEAVEVYSKLGHGSGVDPQTLRRHYGEAFYTNTDETVIALSDGTRLDWSSYDNSHPDEYRASIKVLADALGLRA